MYMKQSPGVRVSPAPHGEPSTFRDCGLVHVTTLSLCFPVKTETK